MRPLSSCSRSQSDRIQAVSHPSEPPLEMFKTPRDTRQHLPYLIPNPESGQGNLSDGTVERSGLFQHNSWEVAKPRDQAGLEMLKNGKGSSSQRVGDSFRGFARCGSVLLHRAPFIGSLVVPSLAPVEMRINTSTSNS